MARNQKTEVQTQRVRYPVDGPVEALRGSLWDVPMAVANKSAWIESQHRESEARAAAAAEQELRQQQVLADRIAQQRSADVDLSEVAALRAEVAELRALLTQPDAARFVEISSGVALAMARTHDAQTATATMQDAVQSGAAVVQELNAETVAQAEASLALLKGQQELINGAFGSYSEALQRGEDRLNQQEQTISALATKVGNNWEVVDNAARINETAIGQARQAATELVTDQLDQFRLFLSVALQALGVKESDFTGALNRLDEGLQPGAFLISQSYLQQVVAIAQKHQAARADAERRTQAAAALSPR